MENFRLRVFRTVARTLNFRAAAEELFLSQPAVSQQIKALEEELKVSLFSRSGGRVGLTAAGELLKPYADRLAQLAQEATDAVAAHTGETAGHLALAASQTIGQYVLPRLIAAFLGEHPRLHVEIHGGNTLEVLASLRAGHVQMALIEGPALSPELQITPFLRDRMVLVVPAGHEWAGKEMPLDTLKALPLLMREHGSGSRRVVEQALAAAGLPARDLCQGLTFDSTEGLLNAVEAGLGVTFVSRWAVRNQRALGTVRLARVQGLRIRRMFSVACPAGPEPASAAGAFLRFVLERAPEIARPGRRARHHP